MKTWKLVSGILTLISVLVQFFTSCSMITFSTLGNYTDSFKTTGLLMLITSAMMLAAGIVSISTRGGINIGGNIVLIILYGASAIMELFCLVTFWDMIFLAIWNLLCVAMATISLFRCLRGYYE